MSYIFRCHIFPLANHNPPGGIEPSPPDDPLLQPDLLSLLACGWHHYPLHRKRSILSLSAVQTIENVAQNSGDLDGGHSKVLSPELSLQICSRHYLGGRHHYRGDVKM